MDYNRYTIDTLKKAFCLLSESKNPTEIINAAILKLEIVSDNMATENKPQEVINDYIADLNYIKKCYGCPKSN